MSLAAGEILPGPPASQDKLGVILENTCSKVVEETGYVFTPDPNAKETKPAVEVIFTAEKVSAYIIQVPVVSRIVNLKFTLFDSSGKPSGFTILAWYVVLVGPAKAVSVLAIKNTKNRKQKKCEFAFKQFFFTTNLSVFIGFSLIFCQSFRYFCLLVETLFTRPYLQIGAAGSLLHRYSFNALFSCLSFSISALSAITISYRSLIALIINGTKSG